MSTWTETQFSEEAGEIFKLETASGAFLVTTQDPDVFIIVSQSGAGRWTEQTWPDGTNQWQEVSFNGG